MTNGIQRDIATDVERSNAAYLDRQESRESNARTYPRYLPVAIERASGIELVDVEGNHYYDCLVGAGSIPLGHNHPVVVDALRGVLDSESPSHTLDLTTPEREAFLDTLFATLEPRRSDGSCPANADLAVAIQQECFERVLIVERGGRDGATVRFLPPLVITEAEVDEVGARFDAGVAAALADRSERGSER